MKAAVYTQYGPPEVLQVKEVEKPIPGPKEILLKTHAAAVTMGDCEMRRPEIPDLVWFVVRLFFGLRKPRKQILGAYLSGRVEGIGSEVTQYKVGDDLFGVSGMSFGAHADYTLLPEKSALVSLPVGTSYTEAAPVGLGLDSLHFLKKIGLKKGERILINGAGGGIGTYAIQLAKYFGAHVTVVDSADKLDRLVEIGADETFDYRSTDFAQTTQTFDAIFDVVGKISFKRSLALLTPTGRYISAVPQLSRGIKALLTRLGRKKKVMTGLTSGDPDELAYLRDLMANGHLKTVIDRTFELDDIVAAHRYVESEKRKGNVVLDLS